jgi:Flp pilus assembly protein TadG
MRAFTWARQLLRSERGNVLAIGAAVMPLMIGAAAVGLDTFQYSLWKRQLQRTADSSALAGAHALAQNKDANAAVTRDLQINNQHTLLNAATIQNAPATGPYAGNNRAVRVVLNVQRALPFWRFFQGSSPVVTVEATAMVVKTGTFCLLTLEEGPVTAINFSGNASVDLDCGIATNSPGVPAIDAGGSSELHADPIMAVGGLDANNDYFGNSTILPFSDKQKDPFADRPDPSIATATMSCTGVAVPDPVTHELSPGCYSGMSIDGPATLKPGTYYIKNGNANFGSHADVTGTGVTLVFTGDGDSIGTFDMNGQAKITLIAPTTGDYSDIAIFRDDDRLTMDTQHINGGNTIHIEGAIYMPKTHLWINGNSELASTCLQIVSQRITFKGNMNLTNSCSTKPGSMFELSVVRLVG